MRLFVGNLAWSIDSDGLREVFSAHGEVKDAVVITERDTGRSKGFGFVEFVDRASGLRAIEQLEGTQVNGRDMRVNEARPRESR
ncbi:RNA-binding protein [bacterium]|nr:RNA-binding protein [bacterium]